MKKLLLIVLIFLVIGAVSAHDDTNSTADPILKDTEYNTDIDDEDGIMEVEENDYISVEVKANEAWSLNVYIDRHNSTLNGEINNATYDQVDIPTSVMIDGKEMPLSLGKHNIIYEFRFINTTSIYKPDASITDSGMYFDFDFIRTSKNPQNSIYRFSSEFNVIKSVEPKSATLNLEEINITHTESLPFELNGIKTGEVNIYLDGTFFKSFEIDENNDEEEIDTTKLVVGSYNLICILETDKVYGEYNIKADTSDSMININFIKSKTLYTPNRYMVTINTTLNICEFPELDIIPVDAPSVNITYTRSIPVCFEGDRGGDLTVYIDGEKVYDNSILFSWQDTCYIPTKDAGGNYFDEGTHDLKFEFVSSDKYTSFNPKITWRNNALVFNFADSEDWNTFLNEKYVINTKLNIINKNTQFIPIDSQASVNIVHTNDIKLKIDGLVNYNLTVFVDDIEIYDGHTNNNAINIKTFFARSSIEETNERDIQTGSHSIRFEFESPYTYDADAEFKDNVMHFKFNQKDSDINPNGVHYQLNTTLTVREKDKTVHILNVKNNTYFDDTEFIVKMDLYEPESDDDWEVGDAIGTQDVGIIVSDENGVVYIGDDLMNVYEQLKWNHDFENELLPKAGTYTMKIINLADNTYDTSSFTVKKASRSFNRKYSSDDFNVLFTLDFSACREDLNDLCYITLDGKEKVIHVKKALDKSKKEVLFKDIDPGDYTATFTLKGNEIYKDVTLKSKVTVKKESPKITYHHNDENGLKLTIDIGQSKTDAVLTVSAGGEQKKFTIDKNTKHLTVKFDDLKSGYYNVEIDFRGNERYTSKTLTTSIQITGKSEFPATEPADDNHKKGHGVGNNTGGIGTGSGNSNATGSGNGTYNGKITFNGKGFNGDLGSQGSGHGEQAKSYEITKNIRKIDENTDTLLIFLIITSILLLLSFIYERHENDESEEY